jgi:hypothetical protein
MIDVYYCGIGTLQFGNPDGTGLCIECGKPKEEHGHVVELEPEAYAALEADRRRIDWFDDYDDRLQQVFGDCVRCDKPTPLRQVIDEAMASDSAPPPVGGAKGEP